MRTVEPVDDGLEAVREELLEGLHAHLDYLVLTGLDGFPPPAPDSIVPARADHLPCTQDDASGGGQRRDPQVGAGRRLPAAEQLAAVRQELGDCRRCKLNRHRRSIVFGQGHPEAPLVFVGEGPGAEEDAQGLAFVGKAGALLTRMIGAMGFGRDDVYICNIVKCRPPDNRDPESDEIDACEPFLQAQLTAIEPRVIVALGRYAAQTLLRVNTPISRLRGQWQSYSGIPLMPTFHPAYLLRNPGAKRAVWQDLQIVMRTLGKLPAGTKDR